MVWVLSFDVRFELGFRFIWDLVLGFECHFVFRIKFGFMFLVCVWLGWDGFGMGLVWSVFFYFFI